MKKKELKFIVQIAGQYVILTEAEYNLRALGLKIPKFGNSEKSK